MSRIKQSETTIQVELQLTKYIIAEMKKIKGDKYRNYKELAQKYNISYAYFRVVMSAHRPMPLDLLAHFISDFKLDFKKFKLINSANIQKQNSNN